MDILKEVSSNPRVTDRIDFKLFAATRRSAMANSSSTIGVLQLLATLFLGLIGFYLAHNLRRQLMLRITDKRLEAYASLWSLTEVASPTRLKEPNPRPLDRTEREQLFKELTSWYYKDGNGMLLGKNTRNLYLGVKDNLICPLDEFQPKSVRQRLCALHAQPRIEKERGKLAIHQLSLLRTRMKADLAVYGQPYFVTLSDEDIAFLEYCQERLWRRPWGSLASRFSKRTVGSQEARLSIEYQLFARYMAPQILRVHLDVGAVTGIETRLWIDPKYLKHIQVQEIKPKPKEPAASDGTTYVFRTEDAGQPTTITFTLRPKKVRPLNGRLGLADRGEVVTFIQFVYP
jgi:hypothetical protein